MNDKDTLKQSVYAYWNKASCGTEITEQKKFSREYFQEIEAFRYTIEPEIMSFAQFTRFHKKKILEIGIGAGTDFIQWVRAGAFAYGIDLTPESIEHVTQRLALEVLKAEDVRVADAEHLPYQDNFFDMVYSWGVIHHSPNTVRCLEEIIRVTRSGGSIKLMLYNRYSLFAFYQYLKCGLAKGKLFTSFSSILFHHQESLGTKAFTIREIKQLLNKYNVEIIAIKAPVTQHDLLYYKSKLVRFLAYVAACLLGWHRAGWFMMIELRKK